MKRKIVFISIVAALLLLPFFTNHAVAKPFYEGKTIRLIVTTRPGGGYDFYGRLIGRFMQKHLPGSTFVIKNVPGAGHVIGTNQLYHAKPNGLTFGTFNRAIPFTQVADMKGVKFDVSKMSWLGSATTETYSFIVTKKFKDLDAVMKADRVNLATGGAGSIAFVAGSLFIQMMDLKNIKNIGGYHGGEGELAMMRGEIDGQFASWNSLKQFVDEGHGHPVMFIANKQPKGYEHIPRLQDIAPEEKNKPVVNLMLTVNLLGRPFAGPPGIPADRLKILQDAFKKACEDPELLKIVQKAERPIEYTSGAEAYDLVKEIINLTPEMKALVKEAYGVK
jgi:tripartite-type tricarboxylate transporter receptor subunit TctC